MTPFVVFFLIGVWHGAAWKYIAFGLYNATIVASSVALAPTFKKIIAKYNINTTNFSWKLFCIVRTFLVLGISKILVKAPDLTAALHMVKSIFTQADLDFIFGFDGRIFELGIDEKNMFVLFVAVLVLLLVSVLQENGMKIRETIAKQNIANFEIIRDRIVAELNGTATPDMIVTQLDSVVINPTPAPIEQPAEQPAEESKPSKQEKKRKR